MGVGGEDPAPSSEGEQVMPRSKYGAKPTVVDRIRFARQKEARRYEELRLLEKAGEVYYLELQPRFALTVTDWHNGSQRIGEYRGDFTYKDRKGQTVVEDVKGFKTPLYRWKKKHVEAQYGITVVEI